MEFFKLRSDLEVVEGMKRGKAVKVSNLNPFRPMLLQGIESGASVKVVAPFTFKGVTVNRIDVDFMTLEEVKAQLRGE